MKMKLPLIAALCCGLSSIGSAFTLDFNAVTLGQTVQPTLIVNVPGYGDVQFDANSSTSQLVVDDAYRNDNGFGAPSLSFDSGDSLKVTFLAAQPLDVDFDYVGVNPGEAFLTSTTADPNVFNVSLFASGASDGAGLYQISFNQVPEPTTSLLGVIGGSLLILRRRRQ